MCRQEGNKKLLSGDDDMRRAIVITPEYEKLGCTLGVQGNYDFEDEIEVYSLEEAIEKEPNTSKSYFEMEYNILHCVGFVDTKDERRLQPVSKCWIEFID